MEVTVLILVLVVLNRSIQIRKFVRDYVRETMQIMRERHMVVLFYSVVVSLEREATAACRTMRMFGVE